MLTNGENLLIHRRRLGLSQKAAGQDFDISRHTYGKRERTDKDTEEMVQVPYKFDDLTPAEKCVIYRKRASLTQRDVACLLGLSRYWVNQKELGQVDCTDLLKFWKQRQ